MIDMQHLHVPATNVTYFSNIAFVVTYHPETNTTFIELMAPMPPSSRGSFFWGVLSSLTASALTWLFWLIVTGK